MSRRKIFLLGGLALLTLALAFGCSLLPRDYGAAPAADGWYIKLQVQAPGSKRITIADFNVTGLNIQVRDPASELLQSIDWTAAQGTQTYLVPVKRQGEHKIEVTHFGERNGEVVQAAESAAFNIQAMKITVIDIVPGGIGLMRVVGQETPPAFNLTGYWDNTNTWADGSVQADVMYMLQTGSTLNLPNGITLTLDGLTFSGKFWIEDFGCFITVAGTISPDGSEINGTQSGFPFGGGSATFRMVRSTFSFGRLDLDGTCSEAPVSLHTDYGYARRSETITTYTHEIEGMSWGRLRLVYTGLLSLGIYPVTGDYPEQAGQIQVVLWDGVSEHYALGGSVELSRYDGLGMTGSFNVDFPDGNLTGSFDVTFGASNGYVTVGGWLSGTTTNPYSQVSVWTRTPFTLEYMDQDLNVRLWCSLNGESGLREGEFIVPTDAEIELSWFSDLGVSINGWPSWDLPGTMTISSLSDSGIAGNFTVNFEQGGSLSGSFDLSFLQYFLQ